MHQSTYITIQNTLLSFYDDSQLHPCTIYLYENNLLKIEKTVQSNDQSNFQKLSRKFHVSQDSIGFNIEINISLQYQVTLKKVNSQNQQDPKIQVIIHQKQSKQKIRIYTAKKSDNFIKLYNYFKKRTWIKGFDRFFQIVDFLKYPSFKKSAQYFIVQQKITLKNKMMKRLNKQSFSAQSFNDVLKQIKIQNKLNCQSIITFQSFFEDHEFLYLVYNQAPQKNLRQFVRQFRESHLSYQKILLKQLLEAALQMQIKEVAHNNIQPSTIQLIKQNQNWRCSLNHFSHATDTQKWHKQAFKMYGYSAPQILSSQNGKITNKSDIFSIGAVFYYVLFGKDLFKLPYQYNQNLILQYAEIDFESQQMKSLSYQCVQLLQKMLQFNPDKRISVVQAMTHRYFNSSSKAISKSMRNSIKCSNKNSLKQSNKHNLKDSKRINLKDFKVQTVINNDQQFCKTQNISNKGQKQNMAFNEQYQNMLLSRSVMSKSKFSQLKKHKRSKSRPFNIEGQIDPNYIDDTHIDLQPKNSNIMTPSYQQKKKIQFKFFTF